MEYAIERWLGMDVLPARLSPEATVALISVSVNSGIKSNTLTDLGGVLVDDVELTATRQPTRPVRFLQ